MVIESNSFCSHPTVAAAAAKTDCCFSLNKGNAVQFAISEYSAVSLSSVRYFSLLGQP